MDPFRVSWFGRDPAAVVAAATAGLIAIWHLLPMTVALTAGLDGLTIAAGAVAVALALHTDGQLPALLGLIRAGLAVGLVLGWHIAESQQALILAAAEAVFALLIRPQVSARQAADGTWRNQITV